MAVGPLRERCREKLIRPRSVAPLLRRRRPRRPAAEEFGEMFLRPTLSAASDATAGREHYTNRSPPFTARDYCLIIIHRFVFRVASRLNFPNWIYPGGEARRIRRFVACARPGWMSGRLMTHRFPHAQTRPRKRWTFCNPRCRTLQNTTP